VEWSGCRRGDEAVRTTTPGAEGLREWCVEAIAHRPTQRVRRVESGERGRQRAEKKQERRAFVRAIKHADERASERISRVTG